MRRRGEHPARARKARSFAFKLIQKVLPIVAPAALRSAAMRSRPHPSSRRRLSWLLWLGLLFVCAQAAANAHAISHLGQELGSRDGGIVHAQCELCLLGAGIGGAAPTAEAPVALHPAVAHVLAAAPPRALEPGALALAYRSRAPPAAPR